MAFVIVVVGGVPRTLCFSGITAFLKVALVFLDAALFFFALVISFTASEDSKWAASDFAALRAERRSDMLNC